MQKLINCKPISFISYKIYYFDGSECLYVKDGL